MNSPYTPADWALEDHDQLTNSDGTESIKTPIHDPLVVLHRLDRAWKAGFRAGEFHKKMELRKALGLGGFHE